jgi:hypothetical protein
LDIGHRRSNDAHVAEEAADGELRLGVERCRRGGNHPGRTEATTTRGGLEDSVGEQVRSRGASEPWWTAIGLRAAANWV